MSDQKPTETPTLEPSRVQLMHPFTRNEYIRRAEEGGVIRAGATLVGRWLEGTMTDYPSVAEGVGLRLLHLEAEVEELRRKVQAYEDGAS